MPDGDAMFKLFWSYPKSQWSSDFYLLIHSVVYIKTFKYMKQFYEK